LDAIESLEGIIRLQMTFLVIWMEFFIRLLAKEKGFRS